MDDLKVISSEQRRETEATAVLSFLKKWRGGVTIKGSRPKQWEVNPSDSLRKPVTATLISNQHFAQLVSGMAQGDPRMKRLASLAQNRLECEPDGGLNEAELLKYGTVIGQASPYVRQVMNSLVDLARSGELNRIMSGADSEEYDTLIQKKIEGELGLRYKRGELVCTSSRREGKVVDIFAEKRQYLVDWGNEQGWVKESDLIRPLKKSAAKKPDFTGIVPSLKRTASIPTKGSDRSVEDQVRRMLSVFRFPNYMTLTYSGLKKTSYDTKSGALMSAIAGFMVESKMPDGFSLRIEVPVPIEGGKVFMPTQFKMGNQMHPLNQQELNAVFSGHNATRPIHMNILSPNNIRVEFPQHKTNVFLNQKG